MLLHFTDMIYKTRFYKHAKSFKLSWPNEAQFAQFQFIFKGHKYSKSLKDWAINVVFDQIQYSKIQFAQLQFIFKDCKYSRSFGIELQNQYPIPV